MRIEALTVLQIDSGTNAGPLEEPECLCVGQISKGPPDPELDNQNNSLIRCFYIRISLILLA